MEKSLTHVSFVHRMRYLLSIQWIAVGVIARDFRGSILLCSGEIWCASDPLMAKFLAIRSACHLAISQGWQNAIIESDSKLAVSFASSEADPPWIVAAIIDDIKLWASQLTHFFSWVNRDCNLAAHQVAKIAFSSHVNFVKDYYKNKRAMDEVPGSMGTSAGFALRLGQSIFSTASLVFMSFGGQFYSYTSFCFLVTIMGLVVPWSFTLALLDGYSVHVTCPIRQKGLMLIVVIGDWVLSFLTLGAASSAASVVDILLTADGPIAMLQDKLMTEHKRWKVYKGDSTAKSDMIFSTKTAKVIQTSKTDVHVLLENKKRNKDACDFMIKGSWSKRNCAIYMGDSSLIIARMHTMQSSENVRFVDDRFKLEVFANVDYAFVVALITIVDATRSSTMTNKIVEVVTDGVIETALGGFGRGKIVYILHPSYLVKEGIGELLVKVLEDHCKKESRKIVEQQKECIPCTPPSGDSRIHLCQRVSGNNSRTFTIDAPNEYIFDKVFIRIGSRGANERGIGASRGGNGITSGSYGISGLGSCKGRSVGGNSIFPEQKRKRDNTSTMSGHQYTQELLQGNNLQCTELIRMSRDSFVRLCNHFKEKNWLRDSKHILVEEKMFIFLMITGHNEQFSVMKRRFQHSKETIHNCFHEVLDKMLVFSEEVIRPTIFNPNPNIPGNNKRERRMFKRGVGALDGTLIHASVPSHKQNVYRAKERGDCYQNVLAICNFNMIFTYIVAGWEGTAHDARILNEALDDPIYEFPISPSAI
uniref:Putative harbinger transposase-derived nuclease domain-containing protein n=1 Tax=Tanacetum cinerariifolium TaxID=118510 RepID=A0A6L2L270_TANCI|nr:putative harbinger transposase-derived nuclease domain-containing protein [Tanacetum cinerariifolium]